MTDLTQTTLDVKHGDDVYTFEIPSPILLGKMAMRAAALRRQADPSSGGSEDGLDFVTWAMFRGMALFEVLLRKSDCKDNWPWSEVPNGATTKLVVDSAQFPPGTEDILVEVNGLFTQSLAAFHQARSISNGSNQPQAVAG